MSAKALLLLPIAALACLQASAQPAYERNWRDAFTPFSDPLHTRPDELGRPLQLQLPPDLLPHGTNATANTVADDAGAPDADAAPTRTASIDCATAVNASQLHPPQQALPTPQKDEAKQPPDKLPLLTLPAAVQLALCHNPQVRASWNQIAQQAAALGQARSAWLPQLTAGAAHQREQVHYPSPGPFARDSTTSANSRSAGASWRLWDFGTRSARTDAARLQLQAVLTSQNATVLKALSDILQLYTEAQIAQARWQAQQHLMPLMQRSLLSAQRRQKDGAGSANDTLQALTAVARTNLEMSRAKGDYEKALAQLRFATGLPAHARYRLNAPLLPTTPQQQKQADRLIRKALDDWLKEAERHHPAILAAKAQWQAAQANIKVVQSEGLPTIDASYNYYRNGRPNQSLSGTSSRERLAGITLTIPLFDGFNTTYKVRAAQAVAEQKAIEYQSIQQQTLHEVVQIHADAKAAWRNLDAASSLLVAATEAATSTQRLYQGGAADILQLNQSLSSLQQAQQESSRAQAEWLRASLKLWLIDALLQK